MLDAARPRVRRAAGLPAGRLRPEPHDRLPLHRRRRVRGARRGVVRAAFAAAATTSSRSSTSTRSAVSGRIRHPVRRGHAAHSVRRAARDGRGTRRCADRAAAGAAGRRSGNSSISASRSPLRAGAVRRARASAAVTLTTVGDTSARSGRRTRADRLRSASARAGRALRAGSARHARRRSRVRARNLELPLPRARGSFAAGRSQLVLIACLLPFLAAAVDLFARCRRRRIPLAPALRATAAGLRSGPGSCGLFELVRLFGAWPDGAPRPISPTSAVAHDWPVRAAVRAARACAAGWLVSRERLLPRRSVTAEEELAGHTARCSASARSRCSSSRRTRSRSSSCCPAARLALVAAGAARASRWFGSACSRSASPGRCSWSARSRRGTDSAGTRRWYLAELRAVGYVPFIVDAVACRLAGGQQPSSARSQPAATRRIPARAELPATRPGRDASSRGPCRAPRAPPPRRIRGRARGAGGLMGRAYSDHRDAARTSRARSCSSGRSLVWQWQDPFTALYTTLEAARARSQYDEAAPAPTSSPIPRESLAAKRRKHRAGPQQRLPRGTCDARQAIGRLRDPTYGPEHGARQRHRPRHAEERTRTRRAHVHARREQSWSTSPATARRTSHRSRNRLAPHRRPRHGRAPVRHVHLRDDAPSHRRGRPTSRS